MRKFFFFLTRCVAAHSFHSIQYYSFNFRCFVFVFLCFYILRNKKAPMPQVVITSSTVSPPPAALQPSIRILKRPSASTPSPPTALAADTQPKSFADREAEYQSARERIFGGSTAAAATASPRMDPPRSPPPTTATQAKIVRNPRGPDSSSDPSNATAAKGFRNRKPRDSQ
jgi:hypothetical protein